MSTATETPAHNPAELWYYALVLAKDAGDEAAYTRLRELTPDQVDAAFGEGGKAFADFDEKKHPRDGGKFAPKGEAGDSGTHEDDTPPDRDPAKAHEAGASVAAELATEATELRDDPTLREKVTQVARKAALAVYDRLPPPWEPALSAVGTILDAVFDVPTDLAKLGYNPGTSSGTANPRNLDAIKDATGISGHMAASIASKIIVKALFALKDAVKSRGAEMSAGDSSPSLTSPADWLADLFDAANESVGLPKVDRAEVAKAVGNVSGAEQFAARFDPNEKRDKSGKWSKGDEESGHTVSAFHGSKLPDFDMKYHAAGRGGYRYWTDSHEHASGYAGKEGTLIESRLKIESPLDLMEQSGRTNYSADQAKKILQEHGVDTDGIEFKDNAPMWRQVQSEGLKTRLIRAGFDAIVLSEKGGDKSFFIMDDSQIHSRRDSFKPDRTEDKEPESEPERVKLPTARTETHHFTRAEWVGGGIGEEAERSASEHGSAVESAVKAGKSVPEDVLADYPNLKLEPKQFAADAPDDSHEALATAIILARAQGNPEAVAKLLAMSAGDVSATFAEDVEGHEHGAAGRFVSKGTGGSTVPKKPTPAGAQAVWDAFRSAKGMGQEYLAAALHNGGVEDPEGRKDLPKGVDPHELADQVAQNYSLALRAGHPEGAEALAAVMPALGLALHGEAGKESDFNGRYQLSDAPVFTGDRVKVVQPAVVGVTKNGGEIVHVKAKVVPVGWVTNARRHAVHRPA